MEINNVAAIVTGGASGLGAATAEMLALRGAKVTLLDLQDEEGATLAKDINGLFINTGVTDDVAVATALKLAESAHGVARILVNCAGIAPGQRTVGKDTKPHALELSAKRSR